MRSVVRALFCLALPLLAYAAIAQDDEAGFKPMFNGTDLTGWSGSPDLWSVKDGAIRGETTKEHPTQGNTFLVWDGDDQGAEATNFELRLKVRIHHGNSGVQYRSRRFPAKEGAQNQWLVCGYQMEVRNEPGLAGFIYDERFARGRICLVGEKVEMTVGEDGKWQKNVVGSVGDNAAIAQAYRKAQSEDNPPWNDYVIIADGNNVKQWINGVQTVDLTDLDEKARHNSGIFALQIHAGNPMWVEFKDLRLKRLPDTE